MSSVLRRRGLNVMGERHPHHAQGPAAWGGPCRSMTGACARSCTFF